MLKNYIKSFFRGLAVIVVFPLLASHVLFSFVSGRDGSLESHSQLLSLIPGRIGNYLRTAFYRFSLEHCEPTAIICFGTVLSKAGARIGKHAYVGPYCMLGLVTLEDEVLLGPKVQIPSGAMTHGIEKTDIPIRLQTGHTKRIHVGEDSWIGSGGIILANVSPQTVIGAGSVLTRPTESKSIYVGNPARLIKKRTTE